MVKLLLILLPLALFDMPVRAEFVDQQPTNKTNYSLVLRYTNPAGNSIIAVPMDSEEQCEIAGATMEGSKTFASS